MLSSIFNPPVDHYSLSIFAFANADLHTRTIEQIFTASSGSIRLQNYLLDPLDPNALENWLSAHQQAHNDLNRHFGLEGNDLTDVDFKDPERLMNFVFLHGHEHRQFSSLTGVV